MAVFLVPIDEGRPIVLDKAIVLIGRQADCDVVLTQSRRVSRRHCCVAQVDDTFMLRDLGSMNGVRINGKRIDGEAPLKFGDVVSIGDVGFVLQGKDVAPGRSMPKKTTDDVEPDHHWADGTIKQETPPVDLSQEMPVAIPENDAPFGDSIGADSGKPIEDESADGSGYKGTNSHFELLPD